RLQRAIQVHSVRGDDGRNDAGRCHRHHSLEELGVVIHHVLQRVRTVVVEVGRGFGNSAQARNVELAPVIGGRRGGNDDARQQRTSRIGGGSALYGAIRQSDLIRPCIAHQSLRAGLEVETRG